MFCEKDRFLANLGINWNKIIPNVAINTADFYNMQISLMLYQQKIKL